MEHLTVVLDVNYASYRSNEDFTAILAAVCKVLNIYSLNNFTIFDVILVSSQGTDLVMRNYRSPLQRAEANVVREMEAATNRMIGKLDLGDTSIDPAAALGRTLLLHNKMRVENAIIRYHKLLLVGASRIVGSNRLLQAAYTLFKQGFIVHMYYAGSSMPDDQLVHLVRQTHGTICEHTVGGTILHQTLNLLVNSVRQFHMNNSGAEYWRELSQRELRGVGREIMCAICGNPAQRPEACRYCLLLYCEHCQDGRCGCGCPTVAGPRVKLEPPQ